MNEENQKIAPANSILPKNNDIVQPGGDDPVEGEASVDQVNIETPRINQTKYLFRMIPNSKNLIRFDVTSMKEEKFVLPVITNYTEVEQPGGVFISLSDT